KGLWKKLTSAIAALFARRARRKDSQGPAESATGSQEQQNYTVFGREVNLASRLESASGRGRIFIGETTYRHLQRDDPALAATCVPLDEQKLKGFSRAITAYEVPWREADTPAIHEDIRPTD